MADQYHRSFDEFMEAFKMVKAETDKRLKNLEERNEPLLEDSYPVYAGYTYVADGIVVYCDFNGNVRRLKFEGNYKEVRRCDRVARGLF